MNNRSQLRKQIALEHLALAKKEFEAAAQSRLRFILLAREYGNTNAEIGAVLGVGESSVRAMVARHGGCTHCDGANKCAACWLTQFSPEDAG